MPEAVDECVKSVMEDNPDYSESRAYAICWAEQNRGNLSVHEDASHDELLAAAAKSNTDCPEGKVRAGEACVDVEEVTDVPPSSLLSTPQHLTLKSLETEPIKRVSENSNKVRYKSLKLLSPGIWADAGSQTETYYPPEGIANLEADYDESKHDGPPVNIMHDLDVEDWEAHEPSVAGHVDPDTLDTDDDGNLYGDVVFDTATGAGQYADENLQSTLEKEGALGFGGPSVEIPARGLQQSHDEVRDMPRVDGGLLTGVAMVMDPASKSVNFAREAARRPVALSGESGNNAKVLTQQSGSMRTLANAEEVREIMERFGFDVGDMDDEEMMEMAEDLHEDLMDQMKREEGEDADGEGAEMETHDGEDDEEDDDEDEDMEMQEDGDLEAVEERVQSLASRLEDVEDALSQAMQADDVEATLEDAKGQELAAADTVAELEEARDELDRRLEALESEGKESKTLADAGGVSEDFEPEYDGAPSQADSW
jgi:hypothetical protein